MSGAVVMTPDGDLLAHNNWWPNPDRLALIDPDTGDFTFLGELPLAHWSDLAFDGQGRLWMSADQKLHEVALDPVMATEVSIGTVELHTVGSHNGILYGIHEPSQDSYWLVEIDPDGGTFHPIVELQGMLPTTACYLEHPTSMAFDDHGGLWVVVVEVIGTCITPHFESSYLHYPNPFADGELGSRRDPAAGVGFTLGLAMVDIPDSPVEVPTAGTIGLVALALLLAGLSLGRMRTA